jgi:hypothetical protein
MALMDEVDDRYRKGFDSRVIGRLVLMDCHTVDRTIDVGHDRDASAWILGHDSM